MNYQTLTCIQQEAKISRRLWVKVLGMLNQNWCVVQEKGSSVELVFFDDHGHVFDWLPASNLGAAQKVLRANGFTWMWQYSSFYSASGIPKLPKALDRLKTRPIYSSGEYWKTESECEGYENHQGLQTTLSEKSLLRFVEAQDLNWYTIVEELAGGRKQTHWMWFVFPQLRGLGSSPKADYFGLVDLDEAKDYWDDDLLGSRLKSCLELLMKIPTGIKVEEIFEPLDVIKLQSCLTLFEYVSHKNNQVVDVLVRYFFKERCSTTLEKINMLSPRGI